VLQDCAGQNPIRHITLKTRQVGLSTLWLLYWLDDTMFKEGIVTGVLAHRLDSIQHLNSIFKTALNNFSRKPVKLSEDNQSRISFEHNNSTIILALEIRSTPLHNLHISEWMFCENERVWATLGATSKWTNITGESTGNGNANDGYLTWMDAKEGKNGYAHRFIPWFAHGEYQLEPQGIPAYLPDKRERGFNLTQAQIHFRRTMMHRLKSSFFVEYPETEEDAFAQSGLSFFNNKKIIALAREARQYETSNPPLDRTDLYTVWEKAQPGHVYVIGADPAEGIGADYSCFKVLCVTCRREVMSYRGHVGIDMFYVELDKWGRHYRNALLAVERNNHGHAVLLGLSEDCHYPNLYKEVRPEPIITDLSKIRQQPKMGWATTNQTKTLMLDQLKWGIEGDYLEDENSFQPDFHIHDLRFLDECLTLQREGNKLGATSGRYDDNVMATAIAYQMYLKVRSKISTDGKPRGLEKVMVGAQREVQL